MKLSSVREGLPFELVSRHVKSHQDEEREYDDLTRPEQLNVQADHRATEALDELRADDTITEFQYLPAELPCDSTGYLTLSRNTHAQNRIHRVRAPSVPSETQRLVRQGI
jgi:hypothetical protein